MGSEDLFHKRRARSAQDLKRREAQRDSYKRALIVCEGEKTEPEYFREWRRELRINHANLEIIGDCDSDPMSVVNCGIEQAQRDGEFDRVFCVFDRDQHTTYDAALEEIDHQDGCVVKAIHSVPCFEYWLLLHYRFTAQPMTATEALAAVKAHWPSYEKSANGSLSATIAEVGPASQRARAIRKQGRQEGFDCPFTNVDELVAYLQKLRA